MTQDDVIHVICCLGCLFTSLPLSSGHYPRPTVSLGSLSSRFFPRVSSLTLLPSISSGSVPYALRAGGAGERSPEGMEGREKGNERD